MIRNNIQEQAHTALAQFLAQNVEVAELRVPSIGIDDVVAVCTALTTAQNRGSVEVRYAQIGKIAEEFASSAESEILIQLQAIGSGNGHRRGHSYHTWLMRNFSRKTAKSLKVLGSFSASGRSAS